MSIVVINVGVRLGRAVEEKILCVLYFDTPH